MRFIEDGPNIPVELLDARDKGEVVFICGAGVSVLAGLPDFSKLTKQVIDDLGVSHTGDIHGLYDQAINARAYKYSPPFDQIFSLLKRDFGETRVEQSVFSKLRKPKGANMDGHRAILTLSANISGKPRLVTTNFDLLFERGGKKLPTYVSPELPDFRAIDDFEGIVYLHGRLSGNRQGKTSSNPVILSTSDFGRAYLSQGWAARFVRELLQRYTVVLLGYSANDPPISYLLEGLQQSSSTYPHLIYAFDSGDSMEVKSRWRNRNVRGISYKNPDETHELLWKTISAWATRAENLAVWQSKIARLATQPPDDLTPVQRGQVAALISTVDGAKIFADHDPSPHPRWICVLDDNIRTTEPYEGSKACPELPAFDPQSAFGLDYDPPRVINNSATNRIQKPTRQGIDLLSALPGEKTDYSRPIRITNSYRRFTEQPPLRLIHLTRWIAKQSKTPTIVWWAARQQTLGPFFIEQLKWQLRDSNKKYEPLIRKNWEWLIEIHENSDWDWFDHEVFELKAKLKKSGWNNSSLRDLESFLSPRLKIENFFRRSPNPDLPDATQISQYDLVRFKVSYPDWHGEIADIPDEHIETVFRFARRGLERASQFIMESGQFITSTPTFFPEDKSGEPSRDDQGKFLLWVGWLFHKLCEIAPNKAKAEFESWPDTYDEIFFAKFKLYALSHSNVFSKNTVASFLIHLDRESFWTSRNRRELLHLLRLWWPKFSAIDRKQILQQILKGPKRYEVEKPKDFSRRKGYAVISSVEWLSTHGCAIPVWAKKQAKLFLKDVPGWKNDWAKNADDSHEGRSGGIGTNLDHQMLDEAPLGSIATLAEEHTKNPVSEFIYYRPFQGLVQDNLNRALATLGYELRKGRTSIQLWQTAISFWPNETTTRQRWLFAHRLSRLSRSTQFELRYYIPSWMRKHLPDLAKDNPEGALEIWDGVIKAIIDSGPAATKSGVGESYTGGKKVERSRRTFDFSVGPIADLVEVLFSFINQKNIKKGKGIPTVLKERVENLWEVPGEGSDHAISQTSLRLRWLDHLDPIWVAEEILPWLDLGNNNAEPAWSGFLHQQKLPRNGLFKPLKKSFLGLHDKIVEWQWGDEEQRQYAFLLVLANWWNLHSGKYVTWKETRATLKVIEGTGRQQAIQTVSDIIQKHDQWKSFGRPFFKKAWPQELILQSSETSNALIWLAERADDEFPDVVKTVSEFVFPVDHLELFVYKTKKEKNGVEQANTELAKRFPGEVLTLMDRTIPVDQQYPPYDLSSLLGLIAEAKSSLRQDSRWLRLRRLADGG